MVQRAGRLLDRSPPTHPPGQVIKPRYALPSLGYTVSRLTQHAVQGSEFMVDDSWFAFSALRFAVSLGRGVSRALCCTALSF